MKHLDILAGIFILAFSVVANAQEQERFFSFTFGSTTKGFISGTALPTDNKIGSEELHLKAAGHESSQCEPYGRQSLAQIDSVSQKLSQDDNSVSFRLSSASTAVGGHFRTCGVCAAGHCVGITGHDTAASAEAESVARVAITFSDALPYHHFDVSLTSTEPGGANTNAKLVYPDGAAVPLTGKQRINPKAGETFIAEISRRAASANSGGCCSDHLDNDSQYILRVELAPILDSNEQAQPFIINSEPASDELFGSVVALTLDGKLLCSGTIISDSTVLTAAHCLFGREMEISSGRMSVALGINYLNPTSTYKVVSYRIPSDPPFKFYWSDDEIDHDIGLVYIEQKFDGKYIIPMLHGNPPWKTITDGRDVIFAGYGINIKAGGQGTGAGIRRFAGWLIDDSNQWTFSFAGHPGNTCSGDSGGPAFYRDKNGGLTIIGVTSYGNERCTIGTDMRVDTHYPWIEARLK